MGAVRDGALTTAIRRVHASGYSRSKYLNLEARSRVRSCMRTTFVILLFFVPVSAGGAPAPSTFTVQALQNVSATVPRATAEQLAESELWREAYVRCSPWLAGDDGNAPVRLDAPKVEPGLNGKDPYIKMTAHFQCGLDLKARAATAAQVIFGRVARIQPVANKGPISEHDPVWKLATIEVYEALKGNASPNSKIDVYFASSTDVAWFAAPKLVVGEQGVWLLQPNTPGPALLSSLDAHPAVQKGLIWSVLHR
jgi:hypothetical protein